MTTLIRITSIAVCSCALFLCVSQTASAQISAGNSDDTAVLVPGISASDYMAGKRAKNGFTRASLTQGNADYYVGQFENIYQITLTSAERSEFQRRLVAAWPEGKHDTDMPGAFKVLQRSVQADAGAIGNGDDWKSIVTRRAMLAKLKSLTAEDRVNGLFLLGLYSRHNRSLAAGDPPLTRKTADALTERMVFMVNEVMGKKAAAVTPALKEKITRQTVTLWPKITSVQRQKLVDLEQEWSYFESREWAGTTEYFREKMRIEWGQELEKSVPAVRAMSRFRRERFAKAQAREQARWAKMSPQQRQMILMDLQDQARMNAVMRNTVNAMNLQADAATLNIIEGISSDRYHYYVANP
ncbi:MAG: hypothetical protein H7145_13865 [Akkermansiaceae bacterium]|nr:hypothetical protein [Armatimonadota bacterium]